MQRVADEWFSECTYPKPWGEGKCGCHDVYPPKLRMVSISQNQSISKGGKKHMWRTSVKKEGMNEPKLKNLN